MENGVTGVLGEKVVVVIEQDYPVQGVKEYTGQDHVQDLHQDMADALALVRLFKGHSDPVSLQTLKVGFKGDK